jgi:hypothetical protein
MGFQGALKIPVGEWAGVHEGRGPCPNKQRQTFKVVGG